MDTTFSVLIVIGLAATLLVLGVGIVVMFRGGEFNRKYGNKLMRMRVVLQGLTILLIVVAFMVLKD
jgi:hypothetical protein